MICPRCKNEIDDEVCWCGDLIKNHGYDGHSPVPTGCDCGRMNHEIMEGISYKMEKALRNPEIRKWVKK